VIFSKLENCASGWFYFFFQPLNFLVESFGRFNDLFPFPSILDSGCSGFDLHLADVMFDVILSWFYYRNKKQFLQFCRGFALIA
jgi:hypothetical protein